MRAYRIGFKIGLGIIFVGFAIFGTYRIYVDIANLFPHISNATPTDGAEVSTDTELEFMFTPIPGYFTIEFTGISGDKHELSIPLSAGTAIKYTFEKEPIESIFIRIPSFDYHVKIETDWSDNPIYLDETAISEDQMEGSNGN